MSVVETVKASPLFKELYEKELNRILKVCIVTTYRRGEYILKEGDEGTDLFVILTGRVEVTRNTDGGEKTLAMLENGDVFGEMVLIDERVRTSNVRALDSTCSVLVISQEKIFNMYKKDTKIFAIIMLNISRMLTRRLKTKGQIADAMKVDLENSA